MSLSRPHVPTDNSVVESFFRNFKSEITYNQRFTSLDSMLKAITKYIDIYNGLRPHGSSETKRQTWLRRNISQNTQRI